MIVCEVIHVFEALERKASAFIAWSVESEVSQPTCLAIYVQKSDCYLIDVFCVVIVVKKYYD